MRTTLTIDDATAKALKDLAHRTGRSFRQVVNEILLTGLARKHGRPESRPYKLEPVSLGGVCPGVDLDRALRLADAIEDVELARKLELRK